ncbi:MAG: hypothetical protein QXL17_01505 [Candidatus Thermoplasmatota archaeon]
MGITNLIIFISGLLVTLIGLGAFINPNLARWINAPGAPIIKAIIALIIGIIMIALSVFIQFPG